MFVTKERLPLGGQRKAGAAVVVEVGAAVAAGRLARAGVGAVVEAMEVEGVEG